MEDVLLPLFREMHRLMHCTVNIILPQIRRIVKNSAPHFCCLCENRATNASQSSKVPNPLCFQGICGCFRHMRIFVRRILQIIFTFTTSKKHDFKNAACHALRLNSNSTFAPCPSINTLQYYLIIHHEPRKRALNTTPLTPRSVPQ